MNHSIRRLMRPLLALLALVIGAVTLSACTSSGSGQDPTYTPAAYYQTVGGVNDCYYVDDPGEVTALISAGLCPVHSVAMLMPVSYEETYWGYYSSPTYYDTYMPVSYRSHYTSVTIVHFSSTYSKQISTAESKAVYKSSTGGKVTGTSKLKFGTSGSGSSSVHGGGSGHGASSCSLPMTVIQDKGSSSTSHGGGSGRSGTSSGSKSGSGSKGGC